MQLKRNWKVWSLLLVSSLAISCAAFKPDTITETIYLDKVIAPVEAPLGLKLVPPNFKVVNEKKLQEFLEANRKRNGVLIFIATDVIDYENAAFNTAEYERYIVQQQAIIDYYVERASVKDKEIEE